ncbi:ankyrin repeat, SAM and basic leucine zipper domain-containing protein 1 isoform X1 [Gadus morhua]|uniref:Ankyrin repeat, SAM and basic leucine zipper domain containing 1 n=1 Tax=Gadus morhua TaxID=8049 RepID=A0A8C5F472_GADMO|nr:ankyrin repeat, SAM and basic leucine zipper domain-containing protein 1 isoform X1 [Gadus morhua]
MANHVVCAFPAGDESDGSNDEWDIGDSSKKRPSENEASGVHEGEENDVYRLKQAISKADIQTVEQLLDKGVDVETRLAFDWTPLMCAVNLADHAMAKLLLNRGASANFSKGHFTVLMAGCTASAGEDAVAHCVELLLSRSADPNTGDRSKMSCLMLAARDGLSKVINLLVSHGAHVDAQDVNGYTALALATQYGRVEAALKLLQLGADNTLRTNDGESPADIAVAYKHTRLIHILSTSGQGYNGRRDSLSKTPRGAAGGPDDSPERLTKLGDLELLLHGLKLGYLADVMTENDVTWSSLLTMDREDLQKAGITDPQDQKKVLEAVQDMVLDRADMENFTEITGDSGSEEFFSFLLSLQQQCHYLTETVQEVSRRFPKRASEMVFSLDPKKEAQGVCRKLLLQAGDLQREVSCLYNLLSKTEQAGGPVRVPAPRPVGSRRRWLVSGVTLSTLGLLLVCFSQRAQRVW